MDTCNIPNSYNIFFPQRNKRQVIVSKKQDFGFMFFDFGIKTNLFLPPASLLPNSSAPLRLGGSFKPSRHVEQFSLRVLCLL